MKQILNRKFNKNEVIQFQFTILLFGGPKYKSGYFLLSKLFADFKLVKDKLFPKRLEIKHRFCLVFLRFLKNPCYRKV